MRTPSDRPWFAVRLRAMSALGLVVVVLPVLAVVLGSSSPGVTLVLLLGAGLVITFLVTRIFMRYELNMRDRLEEQIRLNRALEEFSSRVAHDLRTPLASIHMAAQMLEAESGTLSAQGRAAVDVLARQAESAAKLVRDLLDLARASGTPRLERVDLADLVAEAARDVAGLDLRCEPGPPAVVADPVQLRQAITNLLENASMHATANGRAEVTVSWDEAPDGWRVRVADRGPGLTEEEAGRVFQPFARGDRSSRTRGTGLGLTIVSAMAEAHGGRAWYEPREGGGAVFSIFLPRTAGTPHDDGRTKQGRPPRQ